MKHDFAQDMSAAQTRELIRVYACQAVLCQDEVARSLGFTASEMKCYNVLNCYGAMSPGEIARRTGFTTGGITKLLDHLEDRGAIRRRPEANDRRAMIIEPLAPNRSKSSEGATVDFESLTTDMMADYSDQECAVIQNFLTRGTELLQDMTSQLQVDRKIQKGLAQATVN